MPDSELSALRVRVLQRLAEGRTVKGIALDLHMAAGTVADHKKVLFEKLGAKTSAHAVAEGFRKGLLK